MNEPKIPPAPLFEVGCVTDHATSTNWLSRCLVPLTLVILVWGWHVAWPNLNRDFNHLHGWQACQEAHLSRGISRKGLVTLGFAPIVSELFDAGGHRFYFTHYPILGHALLSLLFAQIDAQNIHRAIRLAGMGVTLGLLVALYVAATELWDQRYAAWAVFFGAVNAQVLYFFPLYPTGVLPNFVLVIAYGGYLRWRRTRSPIALLITAAALLAELQITFFLSLGVIPIVVDLWFSLPGRSRRHRLMAIALLALPVLSFVAVQAYYRFGIAWVTGRTLYATGTFEDISRRTRLGLLVSYEFYRMLATQVLMYFSPTAMVGAVGFYAVAVSSIVRNRGRAVFERHWQSVFVVLTLTNAASLIVFPGTTVEHQQMYGLLVVPFSLAAAGIARRIGSWLPVTAVVGLTAWGAFAGSAQFAKMNNSPRWEYASGVAVQLFTPPESFVRVHLPLNNYLMLFFYADRNLLFDVPDQFRPYGVAPRFDLSFRSVGEPRGLALLIPVSQPNTFAVLVDEAPILRPPLQPVEVRAGVVGVEITGAGLTRSFENLHVAEIEWVQTAPPSVGVEFGAATASGFKSTGAWRLGGAQVGVAPDGRPRFRAAYFVEMPTVDSIVQLRLLDDATGAVIKDATLQLDRTNRP